MLTTAAFATSLWRACRRAVSRGRTPGQHSQEIPADNLVSFTCNVCGAANRLPQERISREDGSCAVCHCYGRLRAMMYALGRALFEHEVILAHVPQTKQIRGIGCSDWGYPPYLQDRFDYVNTYYDHEPQLDLCDVDWERYPPGSCRFITCTDVLEHVEPPVDRAFAGMYRLLMPGGVLVVTVPTSLEPATREHFPGLADWKIVEEDGRRVLVNRRRDGSVERFSDLVFHGGEGETLEFRLFSRQSLLDAVGRAGFQAAQIYDEPIPSYGIPLCSHNFVLVARKPE